MDAYEATKVVFSRIHSMDSENAARIVGLLLLRDHGEEDMIRLAFGPESLLRSLVLAARKNLHLDLDLSMHTSKAHLCSSPPSWSSAPLALDMGPDLPFVGSGWKQCLYYARGYCKNGSSCRFLHHVPLEVATAADPGEQQQHFHEQVRVSSSSQLTASAASFVPSPTSSKSFNNLLLHHQQENQRAGAAAASALGLSADEHLRYLGMLNPGSTQHQQESHWAGAAAASALAISADEHVRYLGMLNPGSRQIYLTFPADSTFRDEDVSSYFSIYGPVQDIRIPYQQKRMFGFVAFVYPETVNLILAKGNPHFVCNSRVLVKPYKEKGKISEEKKLQQQLLMEMGDLSGCSTPNGWNCRDPFAIQQLDARFGVPFNEKELLLRRKLEEEQQAARDLQQAIDAQQRRLSGLHVLDFKLQGHPTTVPSPDTTPGDVFPTYPCINIASSNQEEKVYEGNTTDAAVACTKIGAYLDGSSQQHSFREVEQGGINSSAVTDKDPVACEGKSNECGLCQESFEHILPESPFASPTKFSCQNNAVFACATIPDGDRVLPPPISSGHTSSLRISLLTCHKVSPP